MALQDGPLTGAPIGIPVPPITLPNTTSYELATQQTSVPAAGFLIPIFELAVAESGNFSKNESNDTLTCIKSGKYLVSGSLAVVNDGTTAANDNQANFQCVFNGAFGVGNTVTRTESAMYDSVSEIRRTLVLASKLVTITEGDTIQFWFSAPGGGANLYTLDIFAQDVGAISWVQFERVGD